MRVVRGLRSLLGGCFFLAFGAGGLLIGTVCFPALLLFGRGARARRAMRGLVRASYRLFVGAARVTGLFRVEVSAADLAALRNARGCVVAANHLTLIDVVILIAYLPDATSIAKAAAGRNFFYSRIVSAVFLTNDDAAGVREQARELLAQGVNVIVFPEGTRTPADAAARRVRRGAAQIALHAGAPVLCVSIACDPPVLAKGQPWHDLAPRTIVWTLRTAGLIPAEAAGAAGSPHARAVALTERIAAALWPTRTA